MKFLHLSDLHFGKSIYGISLIDSGDQKVWVDRLLEKVCEIAPEAIVIAGDVYDRGNPSGDAMLLLNYFLTELSKMDIPVLIIAGNHDSAERLSFGDYFFRQGNIHISGPAEAKIKHVTISGRQGGDEVTFWLMPYVFPALISQKLGDPDLRDYDTAVRKLLERQEIDFSKKNVLIAHQNVTANGVEACRGGSESMVGGVGQIDYTAFEGFDYVALGHIHAAYPVGRDTVRYAGSPLCYHFDEIRQAKKGPLLVTVGQKEGKYAEVSTELIEIEPLHPLKNFEGTYEEIRRLEENRKERDEFHRIVLTDQRISPEISEHFRKVLEARGCRLLDIASTYEEERSTTAIRHSVDDIGSLPLNRLFEDFYKSRKNGEEPGEIEAAILLYATGMTDANMKNIHPDGTAANMDQEIDQLVAFVKNMGKAGM